MRIKWQRPRLSRSAPCRDGGGKACVELNVLKGEGPVLTAIELEPDGRRPMVGDMVAVAGYGGAVWWGGTVALDYETKKLRHLVYFTGDNTKAKLDLNPSRYGPAGVCPGGRG